jgi:hypothetical protein
MPCSDEPVCCWQLEQENLQALQRIDMKIDTSKVNTRRVLHFESLEQISAEVERLARA